MKSKFHNTIFELVSNQENSKLSLFNIGETSPVILRIPMFLKNISINQEDAIHNVFKAPALLYLITPPKKLEALTQVISYAVSLIYQFV